MTTPDAGRRGSAGTDTGVRRRAAIALVVLPVLTLAINMGATQFVAWRLHHHPALGPSVLGLYPPWAWIGWIQAPWAASARSTFDLLQAGLFGAGGLICLLFMAAARHGGRFRPRRHEDVHGTARFGGEAELRAGGLLPPKPGQPHQGVYCGAWPDRRGDLHYLMHDGPEHVLALGPLRSGKLVSLVIPTLTTWPHSAVVYDEKGEIWEATAGWRGSEGGNAVLRWEPGAARDTIAFNFLDEVRLGSEYEFRDISNIVEMVCDPDGSGMDGHWDPSAASLLCGVALHVCFETAAQGRRASLGDVLAALADPARRPEDLFRAMIDNRHRNGGRHEEIAAAGQEMMNKDVRERSGIHSTAVRMLRLFRDPILRANTARSDFTIAGLINAERPVTLYVVTRGDDKLRLRSVVRLFLTQMFGRLAGADMRYVGGQALSPHRHRMLVLIDEFAGLRRMEAVEEAMSKCAGYGIKVYLLCQDREQILKEYGPNESVTAHCHVKIGFAPTNYRTAEWWSDLSGNATVVVDDVTESGAEGSLKKNYSRTYRTVSRPLITADEVMRLRAPAKDGRGRITDAGQVLVHISGQPMTIAVQSLYFRDPEFVRRVAIDAPGRAP